LSVVLGSIVDKKVEEAMIRFLVPISVCGVLMSMPAAVSSAQGRTSIAETRADQRWPREVKDASVTVLMYEPQLERVIENAVEARAAVQVTRAGTEPVFGAVWVSARVDVNRDARLVTFRDVRIPRVRFVDASEADNAALASLLEQRIPNWNLEMDLDEFIPLVELAQHENPADVGLKHDPPRIIVATTPTTLVLLDGPERRQVMTSPAEAARDKLERVLNTPAVIVFYPARKTYYLAGGGDLWYMAKQVTGPYTPTTNLRKSIIALAARPAATEAAPSGTPPNVIVATEPTEVIVVVGQPQYVPLSGVDLLAVSNADVDVLVPLGTNAPHYVLLSGRWYVSRSELRGPWSFVPQDELPPEFANIPAGSERAHVRAHVAGTVEAEEALLDNTIPETQAIQRGDTSLKITYDGAPSFKDVEGVPLQYAVNTPQAVFRLGTRYYACDQGVWYESAAATGPWTVSTSVPKEIYSIPASNPHYNVTYVRVYDVTPRVVYVGYTPGYLGSYPYRGVIVYGTGWYYPGWYGVVYYPYPATWGFRATYHPYYGWGYGISWSSGPLTVSVGLGGPVWGYPGYWGPWGYRPYYPPYRPPYYPGYRPPYYPGYRPPGYPGYRPPVGGTGRPGTPVQLPTNVRATRPTEGSLYRRPENTARNVPTTAGAASRARAASAPTPNNVFSSPNGDVYRRNPSGQWDQRQGGNWRADPGSGAGRASTPNQPSSPTAGISTPNTKSAPGSNSPGTPAQRPASPPGGLNRDFDARQRGAARTGAAPRQPAAQPAPRGGGARRGGRAG
jgi:hypothetical protein